jgi:hypothetical protein
VLLRLVAQGGSRGRREPDRRERDDCRVRERWSVEHVAALVATAGTAALVVWGARRGGDAFVVPIGRVLGLIPV